MGGSRKFVVLVAAVAVLASGCVRGLGADAEKHGRLLGYFAYDKGLTSNPTYVHTAEEFGLAQTYMNDWGITEPTKRGEWNTGAIQDDENYWTRLGTPRLWPGVLVWAHEKDPSQHRFPPYVYGLTYDALLNTLQEHIQGTILRHRRVYAWDVTGELFEKNANGDYLQRKNPFLDGLGPDWAAAAMRFAHAADPEAYVSIDETGADGMNDKSDAFYNYVKNHLVNDTHADRVPVDKIAVGLEMHISSCAPDDGFTNPNADAIRQNMQRFQALGVKVFIQGMDVQMRCAPGSFQQQLQWQANKYHDVIAACMSVPACTTIVIEGVGDPDSWVVRVALTKDHEKQVEKPVLFDDSYAPKPAYFAVKRAIDGG
jgi:endo-1,4-beta-xylanase